MRQDNKDRRLTYQVAKELCKANGLDAEKANPAYGYLRLESVFVNGQTTFQFPLLQNNVYNGFPQNPTEQRLTLQDNFVVGSKMFGMYFWNTASKKPISTLITGFTPFNTPSSYAWGSRNDLGLGAAPLVMTGLRNEFWNSGWFNYSMDYDVLIPKWDALQHLYIPRTQAYFNGSTLDPATETAFQWNMPQAEGLSDGFVPMEPNIILSGGKNTTITFQMPFGLSYADLHFDATGFGDGTIQPRFFVIYRGVLLQNTTNVK